MNHQLPNSQGGATSAHKLIWNLIDNHRLPYGIAALALFLSTAFQFFVPLIGSATIDFVLVEGTSEANPLLERVIWMIGGSEMVKEHLWLPAIAMLGFAIVGSLFSFIQKRKASIASDGICKGLKDKLYNHIQRMANRYLDQSQTGDLLQRCTSDIETIRLFLAAHVVEIGRALILLVTVLPIMLLMNVWLTLVSTIMIPIIVGFGYIYFKRVKRIFKDVDESEGRLTAVVQENITGIRVVRAFGKHDFEIDKFSKPNQEYRDTSLRLTRLMSLFWAPSDMLNLTQICLALVAGTYMAVKGMTTIGTLFGFLALLNMVLWPVRMMGRILTDLGKTIVAINRINEILIEPVETETDVVKIRPKLPTSGSIVMRGVTFSHSDSDPTVENISFEVEPGETLAILGPSGAGKSTLMHLMLRFYDCEKGEILLDGFNIQELDRQYVREQFGVVLQEPFLYSRSIKENIRFGNQAAEEKAIHEVARLASIHETITQFSEGYDTEIGERGITLSGGQRQRVAISRALLAETPILLLDDALSAVDNETESAIIDALKNRHGKHTTIVIAHRLSTLAHADKIIVMEKGRIIQTGTHDILTKEEGLYKRLWDIQTRLEESFEKEAMTAS